MYEEMRKRLCEERRQLWQAGLDEQDNENSYRLAAAISQLLAAEGLLGKIDASEREKKNDAGKPK